MKAMDLTTVDLFVSIAAGAIGLTTGVLHLLDRRRGRGLE